MTEQYCPICCREMHDQRHVLVECFYQVDEIVKSAKPTSITKRIGETTENRRCMAYQVNCCKQCRGEFMGMMKRWSEGEFIEVDDKDATVPVRINGATRMMTVEQYENWKKLTKAELEEE